MILILVWLVMMTKTSIASMVEKSGGIVIPSDRRRGMSSCACEDYSCFSMSYSYSYSYTIKGGPGKKSGNDCYELCCDTTGE